MDKLKAAIQRADRIKRLLNDEDIALALLQIESKITELWSNSKSDESDYREECYRELRGLKALKSRLKIWIDDGIKAEEQLNLRNKP